MFDIRADASSAASSVRAIRAVQFPADPCAVQCAADPCAVQCAEIRVQSSQQIRVQSSQIRAWPVMSRVGQVRGSL